MIGIVADDITGANDIGAMFAVADYETHVYTYVAGEPVRLVGQPDVAILDTNSRYFGPEDAYRAVCAATRDLRAMGCDRLFKKTCSVFRGNVGSEFDAMMDALGPDFSDLMVVVPGYPSNNRTTHHGIQYVFDKRLEESHFRHDPIHPMTESNIVDILSRQTKRAVGHVDIDIVAQGPCVLKELIGQMRSRAPYLLFDVPDQAALRVVAEATCDERVFGGSAGLASELAPLWRPDATPAPEPELPATPGLGLLVVAGSLTPVTAGQVERLEKRGGVRLEMDALAIFDGQRRDTEMARLVAAAVSEIRSGRDVVLATPGLADQVAETLEEAKRQGLTEADAGRCISDALASVTGLVLRETGQNRLLAAGGDTAAAVCARLGIRSLRLGQPVEPGLPLCTGFSDPPVRLVLKGGSMGTPDFIVKALEDLRAS